MSKRSIDQISRERMEEMAPFGSLGRVRTARGTWFETNVGLSTGRRIEPATLRPSALTAEDFRRFAMEKLAQELPGNMTGLQDVAALSTRASNAIFRAAEEEEQHRLEKEREAVVAQRRATQLRLCRARLSEETMRRQELSWKVLSLSLMKPLLKKSQQKCREAKMAQLTLLKELELQRAELAETRAENAGLKMAELAREIAREEENATREDRDP